MDQEFMDEIDRDLLDNGPGEQPYIRLAKAEHQVRELTATNRRLEAELAEARKNGERLDWLARRTHWVDERMHLGLCGAIDAARGAK